MFKCMVGEDRWPAGVSNLQNSRPRPNLKSAGLVPTDKLVNIRPCLEKLKRIKVLHELKSTYALQLLDKLVKSVSIIANVHKLILTCEYFTFLFYSPISASG